MFISDLLAIPSYLFTWAYSKLPGQVVSCDQGANITLQVHDEVLYGMLQDITIYVDNATAQLNSDITGGCEAF